MDLKTMEIHPFSGFQVTQQAGDDIRRLVTESKWRKLQKHFSISICFSCCRCELMLFDLGLLYDHFSTVHQVDLSYIESLLKESEERITDTETNSYTLSENLIEELIQLNNTLKIKNKIEKELDLPEVDDDVSKDDSILTVSPKLDSPRRKGRPRKRSSQNVSSKVKDARDSNEDSVVTVEKKTRKGRKTRQNRKIAEAKDRNEKSCSEIKRPTTHKTRSASKTVTKTSEDVQEEPNDISDEVICDNETTEHIPALVDEVVLAHSPLKETTVKRATVGRNVDSEEIKAKTCAICKEIMPTIKDCFGHYEVVHDYVPKSVYEKPPVDTKFEKNKAKKANGRAKTDGNAEQCRFCGKMFLKDNIDKHIHLRHYWLRIERKEKRRQIVVCDICGKLYHHKQNLEAHMAAAHRGKPRRKPAKSLSAPKVHMCQTCGYTTPEIRRLKNHIAAHHEGIMPFQCDQCSFQTWEPSSWRCHKQRHSEEKKYKCTECSYQCIQRKQLRRHMGVKHQTLLPKKWKRKDDTSATGHTGSKLLQHTPYQLTNKQMENQLKRQLGGESGTTLVEGLQFEANSSVHENVQLVQFAPTVEVSSLHQSGLSVLSGDVVPTEVVVTVANTTDYSSSKTLTSVAISPADMKNFPRTSNTAQLTDSPVVIPPSTGGLRAVLEEPPVTSHQLVLADNIIEEQQELPIEGTAPRGRYHKSDFPLLHDIIHHRPDGPVVQASRGGSVSRAAAASHSSSLHESRENVEIFSIVSPEEIGQAMGGQVLVLDSTTDNVVGVYSRTGEQDTSVSTIDIRQASELTEFLPTSGHNQTNQGKVLPVSLKGVAHRRRDPTPVESGDQEGMKSLEQDIAQTLIRINPLSRLQNNKSERIQK